MSAADDRRAHAAVHGDADVGQRERGGVVDAVADHHHRARAAGAATRAPRRRRAWLPASGRRARRRPAARVAPPTRATTPGWSPERMRTRMPRARSAATVARASGRKASPMPATPATCPSTATKTGLRPSATIASARAAGRRGDRGAARLDEVRAVADAHVVAVDPAGDALAGAPRRTSSTVRTTCMRAARRRAWNARATACDDSRFEGARQLAARRRRRASAATVARPSVSVPVLSSSTVSTWRRRSRASGFLTKMPARAARISATDMASGTDRPSAHGHDTTSSATTRSSATSGPRAQPRQPGDGGQPRAAPARSAAPARRWSASSAGLRDSASCTSASSAPTRVLLAGGVHAHDQARAEVGGAGVHRVALAHRQGHGLAREHGVVERRPADEHDAVDRHQFAGAHLDAVARRRAPPAAPRRPAHPARRRRGAGRTRGTPRRAGCRRARAPRAARCAAPAARRAAPRPASPASRTTAARCPGPCSTRWRRRRRASAIAIGRSMWTMPARRPAIAVWKNGRAENSSTGTATTKDSQRKKRLVGGGHARVLAGVERAGQEHQVHRARRGDAEPRERGAILGAAGFLHARGAVHVRRVPEAVERAARWSTACVCAGRHVTSATRAAVVQPDLVDARAAPPAASRPATRTRRSARLRGTAASAGGPARRASVASACSARVVEVVEAAAGDARGLERAAAAGSTSR